MFPTSFKEENAILGRPPGTTADECEPLNVWKGKGSCEGTNEEVEMTISCWKCTKEELEEINRTGRVWLFIYGQFHPPVAVGGINPFGS